MEIYITEDFFSTVFKCYCSLSFHFWCLIHQSSTSIMMITFCGPVRLIEIRFFIMYRTSLQYGIACLKRVNYDRIELDRRREEGNDDIKGMYLQRLSIEKTVYHTNC
jgi:hypothetical protein